MLIVWMTFIVELGFILIDDLSSNEFSIESIVNVHQLFMCSLLN